VIVWFQVCPIPGVVSVLAFVVLVFPVTGYFSLITGHWSFPLLRVLSGSLSFVEGRASAVNSCLPSSVVFVVLGLRSKV